MNEVAQRSTITGPTPWIAVSNSACSIGTVAASTSPRTLITRCPASSVVATEKFIGPSSTAGMGRSSHHWRWGTGDLRPRWASGRRRPRGDPEADQAHDRDVVVLVAREEVLDDREQPAGRALGVGGTVHARGRGGEEPLLAEAIVLADRVEDPVGVENDLVARAQYDLGGR